MTHWANKKVQKRKNSTSSRSCSKENVTCLTRSQANRSNAAADNLTATQGVKRLQQCGGGRYQMETYYDCQPCLCRDMVGDNPMVGNVFNDMKNVKEFKRILKKIVLNSNALYKQFCQAYCSSKKLGKNSNEECCLKCAVEKSCKQVVGPKEVDSINPFDVVQVVLPTNCNALPMKNGIKDEEPEKKTSFTNDTGQQPKATMLLEDLPYLLETNICQPVENNLIPFDFCEKCAILRGELPLLRDLKNEISRNKKTAPVCQSVINYCKPIATLRNNVKEMPISLPLPLKVQIDTQAKQTEFLIGTSDDSASPTPSTEGPLTDILTKKLPVESQKIQDSMEIATAILPETSIKAGTEETTTPPSTTRLEVLKLKADRLREELLHEIQLTLEQNSPTAAMLALEGQYLSLPDDKRQKNQEPLKTTPSRPFLNAGQSRAHVKSNLMPKASTLHNKSHNKRNEMRKEIQQQLKDLLQPNNNNAQQVYGPEERISILLDFHKLFHPKDSNKLSKELRQKEALRAIHYILEPELPHNPATEGLKFTESAINVLDNLKQILNLKTNQNNKSVAKRYHRGIKEKILDNLRTILKPRNEQNPNSQTIRDSILHDLCFMLQTCKEKSSSEGLHQASQLQYYQGLPNEIKDDLIADLKYMLSTSSGFTNQTNSSGTSVGQNLKLKNQTLPLLLCEEKVSQWKSPNINTNKIIVGNLLHDKNKRDKVSFLSYHIRSVAH